ncbi:hypothetical protein E2C01_054239 [Portunus trituberculatus]|uniref:Uncharacterized protein n=1 Tax=Portunus trituberculatus TaxID=210409 RepID=A0A5B7GJD2_PORTR|nr:hypothetical protein [Portunus trituberculatus]
MCESLGSCASIFHRTRVSGQPTQVVSKVHVSRMRGRGSRGDPSGNKLYEYIHSRDAAISLPPRSVGVAAPCKQNTLSPFPRAPPRGEQQSLPLNCSFHSLHKPSYVARGSCFYSLALFILSKFPRSTLENWLIISVGFKNNRGKRDKRFRIRVLHRSFIPLYSTLFPHPQLQYSVISASLASPRLPAHPSSALSCMQCRLPLTSPSPPSQHLASPP